jgi:transcriptional regulator with XRE-family HTH domain
VARPYPNRLRQLRGHRFTQEEMAERTGVSLSTYRTWEDGARRPRPYSIRALCAAFGVGEAALGFDTGPSAESAPTDDFPKEPLGTVNDLVEWLADASDQPVDVLHRRVGAHVARLKNAGSSGDRSQPRIGRQRLADELIAYYGREELAGQGLLVYAVGLAGRDISLSIVTRPNWQQCSVRLPFPTAVTPASTPTEYCSLIASPPADTNWSALIDHATELLAHVEVGAQLGTGRVLINRPLYRLLEIDIGADQLRAVFTLDWFVRYALSNDLLENELTEAIVQSPSTEASGMPMPLRDELLSSASAVVDFRQRLCVGGPVALFAVARPAGTGRPADFLIVVQRRSSRVLNVPGRLAVIPKGFHQHMRDAREEVCLSATVYRELEEELFGRRDFDEATGRSQLGLVPHHVNLLTEPMRWLVDHDAIDARCVGFGVNLMTGNYEFACLICIPDEEFWKRYGGAFLPNWEAADVQTYSSANPDALAELILDHRWTDEGLFAFLEGLRRLKTLHPERVHLPELQPLL